MRELLSDRNAAGKALAQRLAGSGLHGSSSIVLALPRGGVPVAAEIAIALGASMDLLFVRKIGLPWQPELALAALVDGDPPELVLNEEVAADCPVGPRYVEEERARELDEIARRRAAYLAGRAPLDVRGRDVIVVDDGLATGTTARAALQALRRREPARLSLAVPVSSWQAAALVTALVDEFVCLATPEPFHAIGLHYTDFHQLEDEEVRAELKRVDAALASKR
jgi:putative phosphoribosyl transferase